MADETEKLIARANAAMVEATRLIQANLCLQAKAYAQLKRMSFRSSFEPKTFRLYTPNDFPDRYRPYQAFPREVAD